MGALFGLVTSLVIFGIRCSVGVNPESSSEDSLIFPEYGFLHFSVLFFLHCAGLQAAFFE